MLILHPERKDHDARCARIKASSLALGLGSRGLYNAFGDGSLDHLVNTLEEFLFLVMAKFPGQTFRLTRLPFPPSLAIYESLAFGRRELTGWGAARLGALASPFILGLSPRSRNCLALAISDAIPPVHSKTWGLM